MGTKEEKEGTNQDSNKRPRPNYPHFNKKIAVVISINGNNTKRNYIK